ncbi:MAG: hypothetical protein LAT62_08555 [Natronospirillum sp.]|uniref:hypothetical protein n=1 Tax=Natronospirillum sp. TaxID=2812955 RepID=UPI0026006EB7|nr:hypothetical protein [Natronospirillum sp.]MCH8551972.1 hypothetical protein [Natronospirillum sp.]
MSPKLVHFPTGQWQVLFGGHVQLGTAPIPEYTYYVPLAKVRASEDSPGSNFMYVKVGIGDLPFITPGAVFQDGKHIETDANPSFSLHIQTGKEAIKHERTLSQFLDAFMTDNDPLGYFHALRLATKNLASLAEAPVVAFKTSTPRLWLVASAAEWYRHVYGLTDYLAHTFLMPSFQEIENRLVVIDRTGMIPRTEVDHPLLPKVDEILAVVPRTRVPDRCAPLYTSIKLASKGLSDLAQRNSLYAAQSIRAAAADGRSGPYWLRFGHPYPDRFMPVTGRGIKGTLTTIDKDSNPKTLHAIFLTSIIRHPHPPGLPYCILERENDGNSLAKTGGEKPLPCDESEMKVIPRFEAITGEDDDPSTLTPDANPKAGYIATRYEGVPFDDTGAPQIIKLERTGNPDPSLVRRVQKHESIIDFGEKTTNQAETETSKVGPTSVEPKCDIEIESAQSLSALMITLNSLEGDGTIHNLRPINYLPSKFSINGMALQEIPPSTDSERWLQMPNRDDKRLMLAVSFEYRDSLFIVLDPERRGRESFSCLLARCSLRKAVEDGPLYANVDAVVKKLREAKGILSNAGIKDGFFEVQALKHQKEEHAGGLRVRRSYVLGKLDSMIMESVSDCLGAGNLDKVEDLNG